MQRASGHPGAILGIRRTMGSHLGDADFNVSELYGMAPASTSGDPKSRTPADNRAGAEGSDVAADLKELVDRGRSA